MPIPLIGYLINLPSSRVYEYCTFTNIHIYIPLIILLCFLKKCFSGVNNKADRRFNGSVFLVTGGTSGIGAEVVEELAKRGAHIILLVRSSSDSWTIDYINDLRVRTNNQMIYAETCNLSSLYSVRQFATKWIDNVPPRRLDMVICCAGVMLPPFKPKLVTEDGIELHWGVNYLAHFHLLNLIFPALRSQPPGRDVRVIVITCPIYIYGDLDLTDLEFHRRGYPSSCPWKCFGASKIALMNFVIEFQSRLSNCKEKDGLPNNVRCYVVDPGFVRSHMMLRFLSFGTLWGLFLYIFMWPFWYIVLKSCKQGAQSLLYCLMSSECGTGQGGKLVVKCSLRDIKMKRYINSDISSRLWKITETYIMEIEKREAIKQDELKMQSLSRVFGVSEPIRRKMELKIIDSEFVPSVFGGSSNIHRDILIGNDSSIDIDEIFSADYHCFVDFHNELEENSAFINMESC
ncbi:hypothetical protein PORY_001104 [Pneumocystis oryctolagi]|uniref:Uncharacterized protein n=1 Tax=Pneumocystis oryctolagi TaxID=42067 RepID=A0ACB7CD92_9ASCO|nr:hypothetical protein PORY_001104 [Pneumocystis oryctolagi]